MVASSGSDGGVGVFACTPILKSVITQGGVRNEVSYHTSVLHVLYHACCEKISYPIVIMQDKCS